MSKASGTTELPLRPQFVFFCSRCRRHPQSVSSWKSSRRRVWCPCSLGGGQRGCGAEARQPCRPRPRPGPGQSVRPGPRPRPVIRAAGGAGGAAAGAALGPPAGGAREGGPDEAPPRPLPPQVVVVVVVGVRSARVWCVEGVGGDANPDHSKTLRGSRCGEAPDLPWKGQAGRRPSRNVTVKTTITTNKHASPPLLCRCDAVLWCSVVVLYVVLLHYVFCPNPCEAGGWQKGLCSWLDGGVQ